MGGVQVQGGIPRTVTVATGTAVVTNEFPFITNWVKLRNLGSVAVKAYFTEDDSTNDENFITIPVAAAATPHGEWEGPIALQTIYFKSASTGSVEVTATQRRG